MAVGIEKALLYEKYRLPYASEAIDDLLEYTAGSEIVADVGAGTGQLAELFVERCKKVYLVEPDPAMRYVASGSLVNFTSIEIYAGSAEKTGLSENSVDLIVIGNAFHRFKPEACDELRRVLKPNGWIALFTYGFNNQAFTEMLFSKLEELKELSGRVEQNWYSTPVEQLFGKAHVHRWNYALSIKEGWTEFFGAARAGFEAPEPHDLEFSQFERLNREVFETFAIDGRIQIDYETRLLVGQPQFR